MSRINSNIAAGFALVVLLVAAEFMASGAFAQIDDSTPYSETIGGRISPEVDKERAEAIMRGKPGDPIAGKEKSQLCQGCHGEVGISTNPEIPKLAGQFSNYISKQIRNYQSGKRTHQIMSAMAATINDDDLADIADYFASQDKMKGNGSADNQLGRKLFSNTNVSNLGLACINCHGERGQGLEPKISVFPVIGGQHKDYIRRQLVNFRDGNRTNTPNGMMNKMTGALTDDQIESLAEYISQQPGSTTESSQTPVDHKDRTHKSRTN
jgi:cytochrome c553